MKLVALSLAILCVASTSYAGASICYKGEVAINAAYGTAARIGFEIKDGKFNSTILNPQEILKLRNGTSVKVSEAFTPDSDVELVNLEGVRCPCVAVESRDHRLKIMIEELADGSKNTTIDYFGYGGLASNVVECTQ